MKRFFYALIALCVSYTSNVSADPYYSDSFNDCCQPTCCPPTCCETACCPDWLDGWNQDWSVEFRVAAFLPTSRRVRDIYSDVWADYQVQVGKKFWCNWQIFGEFSGFEKRGHSSLGDRTKLRVYPVSLGVKYFFDLCSNLEAYVGGGVVYSWLRIHDESPFVHQHVRHDQFGGVIKTGLIYNFCNCWFVDIFADYLFQRFHFHGVSCDPYVTRHKADLSGFKLGGGIGYNF